MTNDSNPTQRPAEDLPVFDLDKDFEQAWEVWKNERPLLNKRIDDLAALIAKFGKRCEADMGGAIQTRGEWPTLYLLKCRIAPNNVISGKREFPLLISGCTVQAPLRLCNVRLTEELFFVSTVFESEVEIELSWFENRVRFTRCFFRSRMRCSDVTFEKEVFFEDTVFATSLELLGTRFKDSPLDLTVARFEPADDNGKVNLDIRKLQIGTGVLAADLLLRCDQFERIHIVGEDPTDELPESAQGDDAESKRVVVRDPLEAAAQQYSALVGNFRAMAGPENIKTEDYCRHKYEELRREIQWPRTGGSLGCSWHAARRGLDKFVFDWCLGYFHRPGRIFRTAMTIIALFTILFALPCFPVTNAEQGTMNDLPVGERVWTAFYFSSVSFTTIGYGDWRPEGAARLAAVVEGLMGLALTACFVVALTRRYTR